MVLSSSGNRYVNSKSISIFVVALLVLGSLSSSDRIINLYKDEVIQTTASSLVNLTYQTAANVKTLMSDTLESLSSSASGTLEDGIPPIHLQPNVQDFEKQPGVVIATKIHGPEYMGALKQQYCLFTAAYNARMQYDMVLFASEEIGEENRKELADTVAPANLTIYIDEKTLMDHVNELNENQTEYLLRRCNVKSADELTWRTRCQEWDGGVMPLAYTWQCEFRSKWIWRHPGLAKYKYMMWMDSDTMCTKAWKQDPIATMVRNDLVLMFDNYPQVRVVCCFECPFLSCAQFLTLCNVIISIGCCEGMADTRSHSKSLQQDTL